MDYVNNILNSIYLYFLSFNNFNNFNNTKNNTTFKCLISLFALKFIPLYYYYLLINLIIYLIKINLSKFNKNSLILKCFFSTKNIQLNLIQFNN